MSSSTSKISLVSSRSVGVIGSDIGVVGVSTGINGERIVSAAIIVAGLFSTVGICGIDMWGGFETSGVDETIDDNDEGGGDAVDADADIAPDTVIDAAVDVVTTVVVVDVSVVVVAVVSVAVIAVAVGVAVIPAVIAVPAGVSIIAAVIADRVGAVVVGVGDDIVSAEEFILSLVISTRSQGGIDTVI